MSGKMEVGQEVFVTRHAVTKGIERQFIVSISTITGVIFTARTTEARTWDQLGCEEGKDVFSTEAQAKVRVIKLIEKRKASLEKQLKKLERLQGEMEQ